MSVYTYFGCLLLFRVDGVFQLAQECHEDMAPFRGGTV